MNYRDLFSRSVTGAKFIKARPVDRAHTGDGGGRLAPEDALPKYCISFEWSKVPLLFELFHLATHLQRKRIDAKLQQRGKSLK